MEKVYELIKTEYGYTLINGSEKLVMNMTKKSNSPTPFYLKRVYPSQDYLTGLFYDKHKRVFSGKTKDNQRVTVRLCFSTANVTIN